MTSTTTGIIWQDPPLGRRGLGRARWVDAVAAELKANPGRWALVAPSVATGTSSTWRKRGLAVRTVTAGNPKGKCDLYACYLPDASNPAPGQVSR